MVNNTTSSGGMVTVLWRCYGDFNNNDGKAGVLCRAPFVKLEKGQRVLICDYEENECEGTVSWVRDGILRAQPDFTTWKPGPLRIWLDDIRPAPEGWLQEKSIDRVIYWLESDLPVDELSLDHDLGQGDGKDGRDLVRWMAEHNKWPRTKPVVHSMNPVGKEYMEGMIERYWTQPE